MKITDEKLLELWEESKRTLGSGWTDPIKFARMVLEAAAPDVSDDRIAALEAEVVKLKREKDDLMFKFVASQVVPEWAVK